MALDLAQLASNFDLRGPVMQIVPYGSGHINDTYKVTVSQGGTPVEYILQRINHHVFPNVRMLMNNVSRVTRHIRQKVMAQQNGDDFSRTSLTLIPTVEGAPYLRGPEGYCWRVYLYIHDGVSYDYVSDPRHAYEAAHTFGIFQAQLADLPGAPLFETIPDFHHTPRRFQTFLSSLKADRLNRAAGIRKEIDFALQRQDKISIITEGLEGGAIPLRVTHNDTKINNILLDRATGKGLCVLDLDTVMPGSVLYDFGDEVRSTTATAAEDEQNLDKVKFRLDMFEALVHGYLDATHDMLTQGERDLLATCGCLITFEVGLRFLTDYLDGDRYFKIKRSKHNLDRCRTQFKLVQQMEEHFSEMQSIIEKY